MSHVHEHHHGHLPIEGQHINRAFKAGILLNVIFVAAEFIAGYRTNSIALLADAGHNLGDATTLLLAFLTFRLSTVTWARNYTYGYRKATVLVSLFNALVLLGVAVGLGYEAFDRLSRPVPVASLEVAAVAFLGIVITTFSVLLFRKSSRHDVNLKGAYLHLAADALVSLGVVVSGVMVSFTGLYWLDPAISLVITLVILISSWQLLKESIRLSLDGVPAGINVTEIARQAGLVDGVKDLHHIHVWPISTTQFALTAHVSFRENVSLEFTEKTLAEVRHRLLHLNVQHVTLEPEYGSCAGDKCLEHS